MANSFGTKFRIGINWYLVCMWEHISRSIYLFIENNSGFLLFSLFTGNWICVLFVWAISLPPMALQSAPSIEHIRHCLPIPCVATSLKSIHMHSVYILSYFRWTCSLHIVVIVLTRQRGWHCFAWISHTYSHGVSPTGTTNGCIQCTSTCGSNILFSSSYYVIANKTKPTRTKSAFFTECDAMVRWSWRAASFVSVYVSRSGRNSVGCRRRVCCAARISEQHELESTVKLHNGIRTIIYLIFFLLQ